jgi:hypothetical protein
VAAVGYGYITDLRKDSSMNKVAWWGQRMAEFQFGKVIQGWVQALLFVPIYLKMYHFSWLVWIGIIVAFTFLTWLSGWACYHFKFVEHFRKKEFKGIIDAEAKK